jgi:hypothetical protein
MFNSRPIHDPYLQQLLTEIMLLTRHYDFAGALLLVSPEESAFGYPLFTTWNAVVEDTNLPEVPGLQSLGFRIRVKEDELGAERAHQLMLGTAHMLCQMQDFGQQTRIWTGDLLQMLRDQGVQITHTPFNGQPLPRLYNQQGRRRGRS